MKDSVDEIRELTKTTSILKNIAFNLADIGVPELAGGITASVLAGDYWAIDAFLFAGGKVGNGRVSEKAEGSEDESYVLLLCSRVLNYWLYKRRWILPEDTNENCKESN